MENLILHVHKKCDTKIQIFLMKRVFLVFFDGLNCRNDIVEAKSKYDLQHQI